MAVAGQDHGAGECFTDPKHSGSVSAAVPAVAVRQEGHVVQLRIHPKGLGSLKQFPVIHGKTGVVAVADDLNIGVTHGTDICSGILRRRAGGIDGAVHTDDAEVQTAQNIIGDVQPAVCVQYIGLGAVEQFYPKAVSLTQEQTAEIGQAGAARGGGAVVADAQNFYMALCSLLGQIGDTVISAVPAGAGVDMQISFRVDSILVWLLSIYFFGHF